MSAIRSGTRKDNDALTLSHYLQPEQVSRFKTFARRLPFYEKQFTVGIGFIFNEQGTFSVPDKTDEHLKPLNSVIAAVSEYSMRLLVTEKDPLWREKTVLKYGYVRRNADGDSPVGSSFAGYSSFAQYEDDELVNLLDSFSFAEIIKTISITKEKINDPIRWVKYIRENRDIDPRILYIAMNQNLSDKEIRFASQMSSEFALEFYTENK